MRKFIFMIISLAICVSLNASLDAQFTREGNPDLYTRIRSLAEENLNNLPQSSQREYRYLLTEYDDIIMNYLIAYEEDGKLAEASYKDLLSNYQEICKILEIQPLEYSPEFYLSYVARQSVADERITAYRRALLDAGLEEVVKISDPLERYRATASWCVEKLKFEQTSGRDLNPVDIIHHSLAGRCEEMQILFVAAARTVGLPARPASTPYWAHMDNNHAWAEVWLEDGWQYTGDMDAAYYPNQTWFSGMVDKTVLILAQGSMATAEDEVLITGRYETVINSTPNYAGERTRKIEIHSVDETGTPLGDVKVAVMVYNWGALRPIIVLKTDAEGKLAFSAGSGDFFLSAYKDGRSALLPVKASESRELSLELELLENNAQEVDIMLSYPANKTEHRQAPDSYQEDIRRRKQIWQNTMDAWEAEVYTHGMQDSLGVALNTRGNFAEYYKFYQTHQPLDPGFLEFLASYDPKFLWQADAALFEAVYRFWQSQNPEMEPCLFYPTVYYEELPQPIKTRKGYKLYPDNMIWVGKNPRDRMQKALDRMEKLYKIDEEKALSGLLRMDLAFKQKYLTKMQYRLLAISILRANGIPADFTRLPDNIVVHLDGEWQYYDLKERRFNDEESQNTELTTMRIRVKDENGFPLQVDPARLTFNRYIEGLYYTINAEAIPIKAGEFEVELPGQEIYLHFGYRISDSCTALQIHRIEPGMQELELVAKDYPQSWEDADEELLLLLDKELLETKDIIILGNYDHENSLRILEHFLALDSGLDYAFIGHQPQGTSRLPNYIFSPSWQALVSRDPALAMPGITLYRSSEGWKAFFGRWESLPID